MKKSLHILTIGFRTLIFVLLFGSIILQPTLKSISVMDPQAFSWLDHDSENENNENDNKEVEDSKEKKVELRLTSVDFSSIHFNYTVPNYRLYFLKNNVTIDLNDPPPQVI
jgi:hypothetical protein